MHFQKNYHIGYRAIKTAIAVSLCAIISMAFGREDVFCASIATIICMQQTYDETLKAGINRFIGTFIGGIVGYLALELSNYIPHYNWSRIFVLPFCILLVIYICNIIGQKESVSICCIVVLVIVSKLGDDLSSTFMYDVYRVVDTIIGIVVAMFVNRFMFKKRSTNI